MQVTGTSMFFSLIVRFVNPLFNASSVPSEGTVD